MTYPPPYEPPNDPLRKQDPVGGDQNPPAADPGFAPTNYDYGYQQPGYQLPAYSGGGVYGIPPAAQTNTNAIISLVCAVAGFALACGIAAIPAIIYGNKAIAEIESSGGTQEGRGMAQAGRIIGWITVALWAIAIVLLVIILIAVAATSST